MTRTHHSPLLLATALLVACLTAPGARAEDHVADVPAREREALAACDSNQVQKGIELLARLWAETLEPTYIYDQGRCYQKANMAKEARGRLQEFLRVARDPKDELAVRAQQLVKDLDAEIAEQDRAATPPAVPQPVSAAPPPVTAPVLSQTASPSPAQGARKIGALVAAGVGVVGVGLGTGFALYSKSKHDDAHNVCPTFQCPDHNGVDLWNQARTAGTVATAAFVVGALGLASGGVLWLTAKPNPVDGGERGSAQVGLGLGTLQLTGTW